MTKHVNINENTGQILTHCSGCKVVSSRTDFGRCSIMYKYGQLFDRSSVHCVVFNFTAVLV